MTKPITGQYECVHHSGVGLDYFTSRIDRITLYPNGRFLLSVQKHSRAINAAQSLISGQQVSPEAPEVRREGNYSGQGNSVSLNFDDGGFEQAQISWNGEGMQVGPNHFTKASDSTLLPPTNRLKQDMDDIAKGLKIASAIGGMAMKAAKTIQGTIQSTQGMGTSQPPAQSGASSTPSAPSYQPPQPTPQPSAPVYQPPQSQPAQNAARQTAPGQSGAVFCDQCGARARPGKRFCGNCGAQLL